MAVEFEDKNKFDYSEVEFALGLMIHTAFEQGIKVSKDLDGCRILSSNGREHIIKNQETDQVARIAVQVTNNKMTCKRFLKAADIPVPEGEVFHRDELSKAIEFYKRLKAVVCKPLNADYGKHVYLNINTLEELKDKFEIIAKAGYSVLVEEYFPGREYRIFAAENGFIAAAERIPANITGNGKHTIKELIELKNKSKFKKWQNKTLYVGEIRITKIVELNLKEQGLTLSSVPEKGRQIFLRKNSNMSTGGDSIDVTDELHPSIKRVAMDVLKAIPGIKYAGIDFLTDKPIAQKHTGKDYVILEVNNIPGVILHYFPIKGKSRNICEAILDMLFPEN